VWSSYKVLSGGGAAARDANRSVQAGPNIAVVSTSTGTTSSVEQLLIGSVERLMCDQRGCKRRGDLRQCERPRSSIENSVGKLDRINAAPAHISARRKIQTFR
jgi:hypothetical protein